MKQPTFKLAKGLGAAMLFLGANVALAETLTVPATVTVNNAINFTFTGSLDFGQVRATADSTAAECVGLQLASSAGAAALTTPAGAQYTAACTAAGTAALQAVGGTPARPVFTIAGVAPFTTLNLALPSTAVNLTAATGPGTPQFQLVDFTAFKTSGTAGALTTSIIVDAGGGATFNVGATLMTDPGTPTTTTYQDLAYTGSFDVSVTY